MAGGTGAYDAFRRHLLQDLESLLLERSAAITHADPQLAVRLGLKAVLGVLDGEGEMEAADEPDSREILERECRELLLAYLVGGGRGAGEGGQVEFFDVWG
jgi:hypothetical protein